MLQCGLIDEDVITEWADSIIQSWNAAKPMIDHYTIRSGELYYKNFREVYYIALEAIFIRAVYKLKLIEGIIFLKLDELRKHFYENFPKDLKEYKLDGKLTELILERMERKKIISQFPISEGNKQITLKWQGQCKAQKLPPPICENCKFYEHKEGKGFCSILQGDVKTDECQLWLDP